MSARVRSMKRLRAFLPLSSLSKHEFERQLRRPRIARRLNDAECGCADDIARLTVIITVEHVEDLCPQLHARSAKNNLLDQRQIERDRPRAIKYVAARIAQGSRRWVDKGRRIEPLLTALFRDVRRVADLASGLAGSAAVAGVTVRQDA